MAASALPPPLREGDRLSREEFMRRWEAMPDLHSAELIDGIVYIGSPVSIVHDNPHARFGALLSLYIVATPGCRTGFTGSWLMSDDSVPQPDITLRILPEFGGQSRVEGIYAAGSPELIVEISYTTRKKDFGRKLLLYERSGVREYVTVSPQPQQIIWRALVDGKYAELAPDSDGIFRSRVFPGLWLDAAAFWNDDLPALAACVQQGIASSEHAAFVQHLSAQKR